MSPCSPKHCTLVVGTSQNSKTVGFAINRHGLVAKNAIDLLVNASESFRVHLYLYVHPYVSVPKSNHGNQKYYFIPYCPVYPILFCSSSCCVFVFCLSKFIYLVIFLSIYLSVCLSVSQSIYLSLYLFVSLSMYLSICMSVCLSVCCLAGWLSVSLSVSVSLCLCVSLSLCLSVSVFCLYLSIYLSIYLFLYTTIHGVPSHTKYRALSHPILFLVVCSDFFLPWRT